MDIKLPEGLFFKWSSPDDPFPYDDALQAGTDKDGNRFYAGVAYHNGDWLPGKVCALMGEASVCNYHKEHKKPNFLILCRDQTKIRLCWRSASYGNVPKNAIVVGETYGKVPLYLGRTKYYGGVHPGKIHQSQKCLLIPYGGKEVRFKEYEVLVAE